MAARPPAGTYLFAAAPVLEAFAEALEADAVPVTDAEVVALEETVVGVGVPETATEAEDCLECRIRVEFRTASAYS